MSIKYPVLPVLAALLLSACNSSDSTPPPSTPAQPSSVSVVAVRSLTPSGSYSTGHGLNIAVDFSGEVTVSGPAPSLLLDTRTAAADADGASSSTAPIASYSSGSGSKTLVFHYEVQSADRSADLNYLSRDALELNGGKLLDASSAIVAAALPAPGSMGALANNADIRIVNWGGNAITEAGEIYQSTIPKTYRNAAGDAVTLWYQVNSPTSKILWAQFHSHSQASAATPIQLATMGSNDQFDNSTAVVLADGRALLFWSIRVVSSFQTLYSCTMNTSGSCSSTVNIGNNPSSLSVGSSFNASREKNGFLTLVWVGNGLQARHFNLSTSTWSSTDTVTSTWHDTPLVEDAEGNITVVAATPDYPIRLYAHRMDAVTRKWTTTQLESLNGYADDPITRMDAAGNIMAMWEQRTSSPSSGLGQLASAYYDKATNSWTAPKFNTPSPSAVSFIYKTLAEQGGRFATVWVSHKEPSISFYDAQTREWSAPEPIIGATADYASLALDAQGNMALVTQLNSSQYPKIKLFGLYFSKAAGRWGKPALLADLNANAGIRTLKFQADGNAQMNWTQMTADNSNYNLWSSYLK